MGISLEGLAGQICGLQATMVAVIDSHPNPAALLAAFDDSATKMMAMAALAPHGESFRKVLRENLEEARTRIQRKAGVSG